jgi:site-specific recombinase XerD
MAATVKPDIRLVSIDRMTKSLERTLRAEGKSENTVSSYALSARLLREFLERRGHDLTVGVSRDDIREFMA